MRRPVVIAGLVLALVAVGGVWLAVHRSMPGWYARRIYPLEHRAAIRDAAARNRLDPALVAAVIYEESKFDDDVHSRRGAVGLMQVLPSTAEEIARKTGGKDFVIGDLTDPEVNILYGSYYLRYLIDYYDGSQLAAIAAYNAGQGNVDAWQREAAERGRPLTVDDLPFVETRTYVEDVSRLKRIYGSAYAADLTASREPGAGPTSSP